DAPYWANNLRKPVQFVGAIEALLEAGFRTFLEISAHPLLSGNVREILKHRGVEGTAVSSLRRDEDERSTLLTGLATLHCLGQPIDFASLYPDGGRVVSLPTYAWQRERHWVEPAKTEATTARDLRAVPARELPGQPDHAATAPAESEDSAARLYFHNGWERASLDAQAAHQMVAGSILILGANDEILNHARGFLSAENTPVVLVKPGQGYRDLGGLTYEINPQRAEDYRQLAQELALQNLMPGRIVYWWSEQSFPEDQSAMQVHLERSVYSVLYLTQALVDQRSAADIRLWYVYLTSQAEVLPQHAALSGSFKTIRQENPKLIYKTVEIRAEVGKSSTTDAASVWELMSREVRETRDDEFEIRHEGELRYARYLRQVELEDKAQPATPKLPLKMGGVYLITGGAGGLGLLFAEHLARQQRVKLVLTGRSPLNADKEAKLNQLRTLGAEVIYAANDISQRDHVVTLVNEIKLRFGAINGVLHVAGVLERTFLSKKRRENVASVLFPKVFGTLHLDEVLKDEPLDFFILFSSISAVKGYEGLFDYAYGNSFMDHYAERRENLRTARQRFGRTVSINWSLWQDGGMKLAPAEADLFLEQTGLEVLTAREGTKLLDVCATQSQVHQCLVGYGDPVKFSDFLNPVSAQTLTSTETVAMAGESASAHSMLNVDANVLREKIEVFLKSKLAEVTGLPVDEFDAQERFVAYGIDSVIVHRFNAKIAKDLGPVSKTLLFENRNLEELTNYFAANHSATFVKLFGLETKPEPENEAVEEVKEVPVASANISHETSAHNQNGAEPVGDDDIAIIGVSGRYPHARNLDEFWENLKTGADCIDEIRGDRWDYRKFYDPNPEKSSEGKTYSKWGGLLEDVDKFDPLFFNLSTKEAQSMDPQERLFLETAWTAFEDAGYSRTALREYVERMSGADVGVFVGCTSNTHMLLGPAEWDAGNYTLPLSMTWSIANRVSHVLDLHGPSMPIDTGCASSLTAIHLACESLKRGECSMALAGGVNLVLHPSKFFYPSQYRMLSPTGRCRAFGQQADGIVLGEGAGAVVLKPLRDAVRDGDQIYAIIKGTASNHGGQVHGYTVPNPHAQASLILQSLKRANIDARTVSCIEAHGTGTSLGDPIEVSGLTKAFREYTADKQYCALGSVKSNIGHLEGAAGIAGLTKLLLQLRHRQLAPSVHVETLNPDINFEETPFYVRSELTEWKRPVVFESGESKTFPRRAGVSSFGAGGSNAHVLLEESEDYPTVAAPIADSHLLLLSARSDERLRVYAGNLASFLENQQAAALDGPPNCHQLADITYTLQVGREPFEERLAILGRSHEELVEKLRAFLRDEPTTNEVQRATAGRNRASTGERKEQAESIAGWLERGQLPMLMEAWLQGAEIDWRRLSQNSQRRIVALPTYPFLRERVWIHDREVLCEGPGAAPSVSLRPALHPLIDSNESTLSEQRFKKLLTGDEFFLRDHRVGEHLVLPGVAIVEMARAAGEMAAERRVQKIKNIVFSSPVSVGSEPKAFYVGLQPDGDAVDFQVYSQAPNGQRTTHTQGKLVYELQAAAASEPQCIDIEAIRKRCPDRVNGADGYAVLHDLGLQLGASFQPNSEIYCNDTEAISRLELPVHLKDDFDAFVLHPTLMDGAQQISGLTKLLGKEDRIRVPYAVGEIEILRPLTQVCYAHIALTGGHDALRSENRKFDIRLADETGQVLVTIKRFQTREFITKSSSQIVAPEAEPSDHSTPEPFYFQSRWSSSNLPNARGRQLNGTILLFDTGDEVRDALRARLQEGSTARVNVILVKPGKSYRSFGDQGYTIDAHNPEDYRQLLEGLQSRDRLPDSIIHLWSQGSFSSESQALTAQLGESIYSIFHLSKGLLQLSLSKQVQLLYAYSSSEDKPQPQYAAVAGFLSTLLRESPKLVCKSLEFRKTLQSLDLPTTFHMEAFQLAEVLSEELRSDDPTSVEIRYEDGKRQVHRLEEVHREDLSRTSHNTASTGLKEQGVCLVTGGLGGLGLIFAEYLARSVKARLVLTGRSDIRPDQEAKLGELRAAGAEAIYFKADVSRREDVAALVAGAKARFGCIDGVIHSAGVTRDAFVRNKTRAEIEAVLAPKVFGTIYLDEALADEPLDLFVMFSSTTALLGQIGQSDYGYANRFMDHFAVWRETQRTANRRHGKSLSINWPLWRDGGMHLNEHAEELLFTSTGMKAMTTEAGEQAFERALAFEQSQLFVIDGERTRIDKALNVSSEIPAGLQQAVTGPEPRWDEQLLPLLQRDLVKTVSALLKISETRISLDKNLSDYGFDSVSLVEFSNQLNRKYQLEITPAIFFEYSSLNTFSKHLHEEYNETLARHYRISPTTAETIKTLESVPTALNDASLLVSRLRPAAAPRAFVREAEPSAVSENGATTTKEPIAIIGMSGLMPQSEDLEAFWHHLEEGHDLITEIPSQRWDWKAYFGNPTEEANKTNIKWGGFIDDVDKFDARFFGISRREAEFMDPQQRIFLETVWKAIEDAGYKASELAGRKIGVFAGVAGLDYGELMRDSGVDIEAYSTTGVFHCILANRVSYLLNINGPSVPVDTGCSSALVAIRQAIEAMWSGSCEMAIAGGINVLLSPSVFISFSKAGMLSVDGRCKTFDKAANGYVRAEGAGVVILKPLSRAIADHDNIHAIIRGSAVNHGGRVNTLTAPNPNAQAELIKSAFAEGDIDPATVSYMEAHGTGTSLGDPIEINGLKKAFREMFQKSGRPVPERPFCGIGSVKTNTGHLETAAAMAGIFKVILAMKHHKIPASIHFNEINPYIELENSPLYLVTKTSAWERQIDVNERELPRRAGVSSFGFGGVSGHLVLEEFISGPDEGSEASEVACEPQIIVLSARNEERLKVCTARLAEFLDGEREDATEPRAALPADGNLLPLVQQELLRTAASVIDVDEKDIYLDESFTECGFDPVHLTRLAERVSELYDLAVSSTSLLEYQSLGALAAHLWDEYRDRLASHFRARHERERQRPSLADVAFTLQIGREAMSERLAFVAGSMDELIAKLRAHTQEKSESEHLYKGNVESNSSPLELVLGGDEGAEFIQMLMQSRNLQKLAQLWVSGVNVDWKALRQQTTAHRISLPTYPFAKDRYWFPQTTRKAEPTNTAALHPLIDKLDLSLSLHGGLVFNKTLKGTELIVAQHNVGGQLVLPGVAHLVMALAAVSNIKETRGFEVNRVLWLHPLVVEGESQEVRLVLREENGTLPYEVQSGSESEQVTYSTGTLRLTSAPVADEQLSVEKIKARCDSVLDKERLYRRFSQTGVTLGSYFQTLEQAWVNQEELLAALRLPSEYHEELKDYFVHPTMMDAALQAMGPLWLARHGDNRAPLLPFAIEKVEFLRPLGPTGYVYVKVAGEQSFNAALLDEAGRVCIKLHDVTLREAKEPNPPSQAGFYYRPAWKAAPIDRLLDRPNGNLGRVPSTQRETMLIVHPFEDLGLSAALRAAHADHEVLEICLGAENKQHTPSSWEIRTGDPSALDDCTRQMPSIHRVYFLGGIQHQAVDINDLATLEESQEQGVISLFRLVKALAAREFAQSPLQLTVVTNDVHQVTLGQPVKPYAASLFGFVKSLAKEYPHWAVNCLDIPQEETGRPELIKAITSEPASANGDEIALRDGRRYVRIIESVELPPAEKMTFRQDGVYLILGGAGGIGLELSKYLAKTVQARLVLIGRGELNQEQRRQIAIIESLGASVLYVRADATDLTSMRGAVEQAKAFGPIRGVIHSALVLKDKTLETITEEEFRAALLPKVQGSVNLHLALAGEALDFMLFFSSAQSFSGNAGQSNYAAGCTFKDAFAHYLRQVVGYEVKTINWGYWGEVGVVASAEYNRRLAAQGVGSISTTEGISAVCSVLGSRVEQVLALHADEHVLANMGADLGHQIEVYPAKHSSLMEAALESTKDLQMDAAVFDLTLRAFDETERFGQNLLLSVFQKMGAFRHREESYDKEELKRLLHIVPAYSRLFEALLHIMANAGFIRLNGSQITGASELSHLDLQSELKNLAEKGQQLAAAYPQKEAHLNLLWVCMQSTPAVLRGEIRATDVVFPNSSMELVAGIYKNNLSADHFNQLVVANLKSHIEARLVSLPQDEKITILEVGAGTGGTSAAVFEALSQYAPHLQYVYSDISNSFIQYGRRQYEAANPYVQFKVLDIERELESQGYVKGTYDVVIATNVLHATGSIRSTLGRVKSLLKTHGWLVVNEGTSLQNFATLTFGLLEGWWLFEDAENRLAGSPLLSCESWRRLLEDEGFERVVIHGQLDGKGRGLGQNVIVAESNGLIRRERRSTQASKPVARKVETKAVTRKSPEPRLIEVEPQTRDAATSHAPSRVDVRQYVENKIIEVLADVLQLGKDELHLNTPYTNLGVDSILSVEIVNRLNNESGVNLRSTDLFNYSTIRKLSEHVVENFGADIRFRPEAPVTSTTLFEPAYLDSIGAESHHYEEEPAASQPTDELWEVTEAQLFTNAPAKPEPVKASASNTEAQVGRGSGPPLREGIRAFVKDVGSSASTKPCDVAVIGMAGRFPEANNVDEFWSNLAIGRNSVHEAARWDISQLYDPDPSVANKSYAKWAGLLSDIELFDPLFFNVSPKEAEMMDPRQRIFLEEAWKALEDAGYSDKELEGKNCSVFVGCGPGDYQRKIAESKVTPNPYIFTGNQNSILAARISYLLNLKGPSVPIDTACSSSLVAIHLACESIRQGFSEMALAGGSEVICTPEFLVLGSRAGMLSPVGQCKTFDDTADGFVPGEAVGALILKNMDAALRDGDHIYGIISGSGINQDGKTNGITSPSAPAQTALECEVYDRFQIDPAEITYVEAHGTGTRLGDPIEVQALTDAFRRYTGARQYCALGSVKTNIGHTLTAAGVSSVIKVLLALKHKQLPPSLNFAEPNRHIEFAESPFYVNTKLQEWETAAGVKRQAAVSSFGFSGTNAHLVLREAEKPEVRAADRMGAYLVVLSAQTEEALSRKVEELAGWVGQAGSEARLRDIAYTLQVGRSQFSERVAVVVETVEELVEKLGALSRGDLVAGVYSIAPERSGRGLRAVDEQRGRQLVGEAAGMLRSAEGYRAGLEELAQMYVQGCELEWGELYLAEDHRRISLPTYPFAREYFWVPEPVDAAQTVHLPLASKLHPLIDRNTSSFEEQRFTTRLTGREFFLSDHLIENQKVLPGVSYLEIARAAGELSGENKVGSLRNVVWMKPFAIDEDSREISISLRPGANAVTYDVWATNEEQQRVSYAQGELIYQRSNIKSSPDRINIESIRERCVEVISGESCYEVFRSLGFDYGPSFRVVRELFYNEAEVLARLELPATRSHELQDFVLHPSLLDGALQSGLWLMDIETLAETRYLPFALSEVRIIEPLSPVCYVHVTASSRRSNLRKFNVSILDQSGKLLVEIIDYSAKAQRPPEAHVVKPAFTPHPFDGRGPMLPSLMSDEAIADLFQKVEAGHLDVTKAHQLIEQINTPFLQ
ncbi:MAG TPA: SDR family NAD(P)-dependent oxidoreductase, partial [Pyrinomonadaceae bacterium]|nr:SDR family NAD(P)-dependent oxidoreductase [Pyrinomonadaceae bacterium]